MAAFDGVTVLDHPLARDALGRLRERTTPSPAFRGAMRTIAFLLGVEATRDLAVRPSWIDTPLEPVQAEALDPLALAVVSVLRAGQGLVEGLIELVPTARIGFVGLYRDPATLKPVRYYESLPADLGRGLVLVADPMLATGGSAAAAVDCVKARGAERVRLLSVLSAPEGIAEMRRRHPDVAILTAAVDRQLDDHGYIRPGLGDAGDRLFGTH